MRHFPATVRKMCGKLSPGSVGRRMRVAGDRGRIQTADTGSSLPFGKDKARLPPTI